MAMIIGSDGYEIKKVPKVANVKALGTCVFVELLSAREIIDTSIELVGGVGSLTNEAYVLHIGPRVPKEHGLEVGQRVFIDGGITFGPDYDEYRFSEDGRKRGTVDYSTIKGVIVEKSNLA